MSEEYDEILAAMEKGTATAQQQAEAARILRDLDHEVCELMERDQGD